MFAPSLWAGMMTQSLSWLLLSLLLLLLFVGMSEVACFAVGIRFAVLSTWYVKADQ